MRIVVISDEKQKAELFANGHPEHSNINWVNSLAEAETGADVIIDLLFENDPVHIRTLRRCNANCVIINAVTCTLTETDPSFVRINGWNTFLQGGVIEASGPEEKKQTAEEVFKSFGKSVEWVPDVAGFVSPRVISMIINEAFFTLSEGVSTKEEIDTAMKLGTNYPYGPFEWAEKIGWENIAGLLNKLAASNPRYAPAPGIP